MNAGLGKSKGSGNTHIAGLQIPKPAPMQSALDTVRYAIIRNYSKFKL